MFRLLSLSLLAGCGGVCPAGQVGGALGGCCDPGQTSVFGLCFGAPSDCPPGRALQDGQCEPVALPKIRFTRFPAGLARVGCDPIETSCDPDAADPVEIPIPHALEVMQTEVSQGLYAALMGTNPSRLHGCADCPVEQVSWLDAARFANALSGWARLPAVYELHATDADAPPTVTQHLDRPGYRLPTDAEWEYVARMEPRPPLDTIAWHANHGPGGTEPVGSLAPHPHGVYDLFGSVWEWTTSHPLDAVDSLSPEEAEGARDPGLRVVRGGGWQSTRSELEAHYRGWVPAAYTDVTLGFRLVRTLPPTAAPPREDAEVGRQPGIEAP